MEHKDPHFDKFYVAGKKYSEGYDRIFKKKVKDETHDAALDKRRNKASGRVQRKGKKGTHERVKIRYQGS